MGSRYTSFEIFMQDVIRAAQTQASLKEIYGLNSNQIITHVLAIIGLGWVALVAIIPLLTLGWLGFMGAMAIFLLNPIGLLIAATFGLAAAAVLSFSYSALISSGLNTRDQRLTSSINPRNRPSWSGWPDGPPHGSYPMVNASVPRTSGSVTVLSATGWPLQ